MTAFNCVGSLWAGGSEGLLTGVVRKEWGFNGLIDTDWTVGGRVTIHQQLRAGGDLGMAEGLDKNFTDLSYNKSSTNRLQFQMREAVHHVLYGWLSTKAQNQKWLENPDSTVSQSFVINGYQWWKPAVTVIDISVGCGCALWLAYLFIPRGKKEQKPDEEE